MTSADPMGRERQSEGASDLLGMAVEDFHLGARGTLAVSCERDGNCASVSWYVVVVARQCACAFKSVEQGCHRAGTDPEACPKLGWPQLLVVEKKRQG
jgi:hypothetical protein